MARDERIDVPLVGRETELQQLRNFLATATTKRSGVLVLQGEPGIGKSSLLAATAQLTPALATLTASCVESEAELAFSALSGLLLPIARLMPRLRAPQRRALALALALSEPGSNEAAPNSIAIGLGTLGLLAEAAPVVVLLDDIQWMDEASAAALAFAGRRLFGEGIAVVMSVRSGIHCPMDLTGHHVMELAALGPEPARELASRVRGSPVSVDEFERLMRHTGGNPLALVELSRSGLSAFGPGQTELPLPLPQALAIAYRRRLAPLSAATRATLLVCASSYTGDLAEIAAAVGRAGLADLEPAESAELVAIGHGRVEFSHPLVRAAVYHSASPAQRRTAHALLARTQPGHGSSGMDQQAWHLAAAALGTDEDVAAALTEAAERACRRGALGTARSTYVRAAWLTPFPESRGRRLVAAATCAQLAGFPDQALPLLSQARSVTADPQLIGEIEQLHNQIRLTRAAPRLAFVQMTEDAARLRNEAPLAAAHLLATAAGVAAMGGTVAQALAAAEDGHSLACASTGSGTLATTALRIHTLLLAGQVQTASDLLDPALDQLLSSDPLVHGAEVFGYACLDLLWLGRYAPARRLVEHGLRCVRAANAVERLPVLTSVLADLEFRQGRWNAAYAAAAECMSLSEELGQPVLAGYAASTLAQIEAVQGQRQRCEEYAARALFLLESSGYDLVAPYAHLALAQLELTLGEYAVAAAQFTALSERTEELGVRNPAVFPMCADLVETCLRANRPQEARSALAALADRVDSSSPDTVRASLARCQGLLARDVEDAEEHFTAALALYGAHNPDPYGLARTRLAFGQRLRRARRRALAQTHLQAAGALFRQLGATPWVQHVERELRVAEGRRRQTDSHVELTVQEAQVARLVARGATNQETADALFLSSKTIEYHLGNIYSKLGLRSRVELARRLADTVSDETGT